jgi:hypothetical protein
MDLFETDLKYEVFASFSAEKANTSEVAQYHIPSADEIFFYPRR